MAEPWCPWDIAFDDQDHLLVTDTSQHQLMRFRLADTHLLTATQLLADGAWSGSDSANGQFAMPGAIDMDVNDNIYLVDRANNRIQVLQLQNDNLSLITTFDGIDSPAGALNFPDGIAVDDRDPTAVIVYVVDTENDRIIKLIFSNGSLSYSSRWGTSGPYTCTDSITELYTPSGVLVDPGGNILSMWPTNATPAFFNLMLRAGAKFSWVELG